MECHSSNGSGYPRRFSKWCRRQSLLNRTARPGHPSRAQTRPGSPSASEWQKLAVQLKAHRGRPIFGLASRLLSPRHLLRTGQPRAMRLELVAPVRQSEIQPFADLPDPIGVAAALGIFELFQSVGDVDVELVEVFREACRHDHERGLLPESGPRRQAVKVGDDATAALVGQIEEQHAAAPVSGNGQDAPG